MSSIAIMDYPKVTICVPVRNGAETIQRTLDSLLSQDYPNYEIIVSDNCSDDNTAEIVKSYASRGVRYYFNPKLEQWGESNWNYILTLAEGPFIALYHADDIYTSTMVRRQVEFLIKYPETSAVFTMSERIDRNDNPVRMGPIRLPRELKGKKIFHYEDFLNNVLKYGTFVVVPTMMTKRDVIDKVGLFRPEKYATASDIDLYLRMAKIGPIGVIDEPLHKYRIGSLATQQMFYQRTFIAHFFNVLDDYIADKSNSKLIKQNCLSVYKMSRAVDLIEIALNMILKGQREKAKMTLEEAMQFKYIKTAINCAWGMRSRKVIHFLIGILMFISLFFRIDGLFSQAISEAKRLRSSILGRPIFQ